MTNDLLNFWYNKRKDFPLISQIALTAYTLPYSSAGVERAFSILRDIKRPKRNRMCGQTLEACLLIHQDTSDISEFKLEEELLLRISKMWRDSTNSRKEEVDGSVYFYF